MPVTISTSIQAYSVTALWLSRTPAPRASAAVAAPTAASDRATLSAEATDAASRTGTTSAAGEHASPAATPPSPGGGRTATLLAALDGDRDGTITKQEFTEAAASLLRRDAPARSNDEGRGRRGLPGLERRLEKAFARIDDNRDGSLDAAELTTALQGSQPRDDTSPDVAVSSATARVSVISVTVVSVAVQRYSALQPTPSTSRPAGTTAPAPSSTPKTDDTDAPAAAT